ncbi:hypothetical protein PVT71_21700 [Salipiger sp. H15]|uniref:Universal stress protein n=1 Tax=Alloyangia sp. H15 TaxID=3029062 RepID=A0AAU8AL71_9RHOB
MIVQTVLTYFDGSDLGQEQLRAAIDAALWFDAQLSVAAVVFLPGKSPDSFGPLDPDPGHRSAWDSAGVLAMRLFKSLADAGVSGDAFPLVTSKASFAREFASLAQQADVVVELRADTAASSTPLAEGSVT